MSSCHLQQLTCIKNLSSISKFLLNHSTEQFEDSEWNIDDWNTEWNLNVDESIAEQKEDAYGWMQSCCFAFSPTCDFLCFAHKDKATFVSATPKQKDDVQQLEVCFKGVLTEEAEEKITSVLCVPLVSLKRTSHGSLDWICVIVGFSSGYVRMYTESGGLLISELFHESAVLEIQCRTADTKFNNAFNGCAEHHDEITILYCDSLVLLDGFSLFQTLRACRNQLAVATAHGSKAIAPPPLSYKKWVLRGQEIIATHSSVGILSLCPFDQMQTASILEGFNAEAKSSSSATYQFIVGGTSPFVGFYYATEGSSQPFLSHVAIAVASKLKSALFNAASGWLNWGQKPPEEEQKMKTKQKVEVGSGLDIRCGLPDLMRSVTSIVVAPGANWIAATSDTLGRVLLLDMVKAKAVRMWKGYRDAQVGFVQSTEDDDNVKPHYNHERRVRMALFLVIYAPRRGILEVWSCINGPRVATFNVGKDAKLICPGFGMFGLSQNKQGNGFKTKIVQCCLLESNGSVKELSVPFHLALSDSRSNKARDVHLLKTLNKLLQTGSQVDGDEVSKLITSMRLPSVQVQAMKKLLQTTCVPCEVFKQCLADVTDCLQPAESKNEVKEALRYLKAQTSLLDIYMGLRKLNNLSNRFPPLPLDEVSCEDLATEFGMTRRECEKVLHLTLDLHHSDPIYPQTISHELDPSSFLRCFIASDQPQYKLTSNTQLLHTLASYIFHSPLFAGVLPSDVLEMIHENINISNKDLLQLVFDCWNDHQPHVLANLTSSVRCLKRFVHLLNEEDDMECSTWREWIRTDVCHPSRSIVSAYLIVLVCRGVEMERRSNKVASPTDVAGGDEPPTYDEVVLGSKPAASTGWETLWPELEGWNVLSKQYEDCFIINTALCKADKERCDHHNTSTTFVSIYELLNNGAGYIPELIGERVCELKLETHSLYVPSKSDEADQLGSGTFAGYLRSTVLPSFPTLLSSNSLHAHCFWHEMLLWSRDPEVVSRVERAIFHLRVVDGDFLLQHGLAMMGWRTFISKIFMALAKLIDKVGKYPKDRLLRKETLMSDKSVPTFCRCCSQLLQIIVDSDPEKVTPSKQLERVLSGTTSLPGSGEAWCDVQGKESITTMGREQPTANPTLLHLNMYLSFMIDGVMAFSLRGVKPLTKMFNSTDRGHLVEDLSTSHSSLVRFDVVDTDIAQHRKEFLFKVVRGAVKKLRSSPEDPIVKREVSEWIDTCVHMAAEFHVDYSLVRTQHVCELVRQGLDELALDQLKATGNDEQLASQLIVIIGQRLHHILFTASPEDGACMMAQMPTTLSSWIQAQSPNELDVKDVSVENTLLLARELPSMLSEDHLQYNLSEFLVEALSVIINS